MAIFYRLQNQSEIFEHVFEKEGIPFEVSLKKTVKDIPVLDWLIRVLRFSVNPKDKSSGIAALADKRYGLGMSVKEAEKTIDILSETRKTQTETPQSEKQKINSDIRKQMLGFSQAYFNAQSTTAEDLWNYFSLENHLHPTTASYVEDRICVMDFLERMTTYQKEQQKNVVVVSFDSKAKPVKRCSKQMETLILNCFASSLLDNVKDCKKIIYRCKNKRYKSSHRSFGFNEVYASA